jgi:hypothetical protein
MPLIVLPFILLQAPRLHSGFVCAIMFQPPVMEEHPEI